MKYPFKPGDLVTPTFPESVFKGRVAVVRECNGYSCGVDYSPTEYQTYTIAPLRLAEESIIDKLLEKYS